MNNDKQLAQQLGLWAEKLRDMAAMGLRFSKDVYDLENYQNIQTIAIEMMSLATDTDLAALEPLRHTYFARPCPIPTADAAIINNAGKILLIQRADNGMWAMPGGATMVGETPAEASVREGWEETGVRSEPVALVGLFDGRLHGNDNAHHLYQHVVLCRPLNDDNPENPLHPHETLGMAWFAEEEMPANIDPNHITRIPHAFRVWRGDVHAHFD